MNISKKTDTENIYKDYLIALNGYLKLTPKELEVLNELFIRNEKLGINNDELLSTRGRKEMSFRCEISELGFNNYIQYLKNKKMLVEIDGVYKINPKIIPSINKKGIRIVFDLVL